MSGEPSRSASATAQLNARAAATLAASLAPRHVVVSPGSRSTPLALAFAARQDCEVSVVLDERAAGFVALGIARATGEPAVLLCTSGSAGAHYLPAVVEARSGRVPIIAITADRPPDLQHCGAPQTMPQTRLLGEYVCWSAELPLPSDDVACGWLRNVSARARAAAVGSPAGAVHLNVPFRKPLWQPGSDDIVIDAPPARVSRGRMTLPQAAVEALARELSSQQRGVIACGPIAPATLGPQQFANAVSELASLLGWPLLADPLSGLRYGTHDQRTVIASHDALLRHEPFAARMRPSLVLRFGQLPTSKATSAWLAERPSWQIDADGQWHDGGGHAERLLVADPVELCRALSAALAVSSPRPRNDQGGWLASWLCADAAAREQLGASCDAADWEGSVARAVVAQLPRDAQLCVASSMPIRDIDSFALTRQDAVHTIANRGVNGIDGSVATALGAALARPERTTVALLGDLALLHDLDGLEAAAQLGVPLQLVVIDNGGGGIFSHLPIAQHRGAFERLFVTPQLADIAGLCAALSIEHERITSADQLCLSSEQRGVRLIEIQIDRARNLAQHERAWADVARALDRQFEEADGVGTAKGA